MDKYRNSRRAEPGVERGARRKEPVMLYVVPLPPASAVGLHPWALTDSRVDCGTERVNMDFLFSLLANWAHMQ